jgi:hypothetical protein
MKRVRKYKYKGYNIIMRQTGKLNDNTKIWSGQVMKNNRNVFLTNLDYKFRRPLKECKTFINKRKK